MKRLAVLVPLSLIVVALAGCTDEIVEPTAAGVEDMDGAAIVGVVLAEDLLPIADAVVAIVDGKQTTTNAGGAFRLGPLEPGSYRVVVQALGFHGQARAVTVGVDEVVELDFTLAPIPIAEPYTELLLFDGYEVCSLVLGVFVFGPPTIPCTEEPETQFMVEAEESWQYLVAEMDWETQDSMWFLVTENGGACNTGADSWCYNKIGSAPLRISSGVADEVAAKRYALDGESVMPNGSFKFAVDSTYAGMFRDTINGTFGDQCNLAIQTALGVLGQQWNPNLGCGLGYGFSLGVRLKYYVSIFHYEAPADPDRYTGMPDQ